jgi:type IV pilus assembly protein PilV
MGRQRHKSLLHGEGGFTLVEMIMAISILCVGLLAVGTMQNSAIRGNHLGYNVTESTTLAQDRHEWLMMQSFTDAALEAGTGKADPIGGAPSGYQITYDVANLGGVTAKIITVTVTKQEGLVNRVTQLRTVRPALL